MRNLVTLSFLFLISSQLFGQEERDYVKASIYLEQAIAQNISVERLNQLEDSIFLSNEISSDHAYIKAFHSYFILRSYHTKYLKSPKNEGVSKTKENILSFLTNEADEFTNKDFTDLGYLISYEFVTGSGYYTADQIIPFIKIVMTSTENQEVVNYADQLLLMYSWQTKEKIPDFEFHLNGEGKLTLSDISKPLILIDFWFAGCPPCENNFPLLKKLYSEYYTKFEIISVNYVDDEIRFKTWLSQKEYDWPVVLSDDNSESYKFFKLQTYPRYVLINRNLEIINTNLKIEEIEGHLKD